MVTRNHNGRRKNQFANKPRAQLAATAEGLESRRLLSAYGLVPLNAQFGNSTGYDPQAPLTAFNGLLYGTVSTEGPHVAGAIYSVNPANNHVTPDIASFDDTNGYNPTDCALTAVGQNLYIATSTFGNSATKISVFNPASGSLSLFATFPAPANGASSPSVRTMLDVGGNLYGVATRFDGNQAQSYIFECNVTTRAITPLVYFAADDGSTLVDYNGSLYGAGNIGIYQYNLTTKAFKVFPVVSENLFFDGYSGLTNVNGTLYGNDFSGGAGGNGSVFQFNPTTGILTTLASFPFLHGGPVGDMTYVNGNLYGTTWGSLYGSGPYGAFEYNIASKTLTTIADFGSISGENPVGSMVDVNGALYGACEEDFGGIIFALVPATAIQLSSTLNNITIRVDPSDPTDLEVLNGVTQYEEIYDPPASITVTGDSAVSNSVKIDYKSGGFFDTQIAFFGAGLNNSLSILDNSSTSAREWDINSGNITALDTGLAANPTTIFDAVQKVSFTDRSGGSETIQVHDTPLAILTQPKSITLNVHYNDAVNIRATACPITVNGTGSANSTLEGVTIGSVAPSLGGTLANILAPVTVNNVSELIADDSGDATGRTGTISKTSITGFGLPSASVINYSSVGNLTARGGSGSNTDTVSGTSAVTTLYPGTSDACDVYVKATTAALTINGNDKVDYITIGSLAPSLGGTLTNIQGPVAVTNTSNYSTLDVDDSGDTTYRTGVLSTTDITGLGIGPQANVTYIGSQLASLTIRGGKAGGTLTETGTSTKTTITGLTVKP